MIALLLLTLAQPTLAQPTPEPVDPNAKPRERMLNARWELPDTARLAPIALRTAADLDKHIPSKEIRAELLKTIKLDREYLVLFAWAGSGGDRLTVAVEMGKKGPEAVFTRKPGLTDDLRQHIKIFSLPKTMPHRLAD
jgi:hypothetical protein